MASSSSSTPKRTYDVFLNFRGEDTRTNFVDHLYTALSDRGIYTFKDDQTLQRGKSVAPELLKAIEQSRFSIVIFSRNYADSPWCLDELVKIIDCKNSNSQTVLPVFYKVVPSEVRKQTGYFGKAFSKHERRRTRFLRRIGINGGKNEIQIQMERWKNALTEAASLSGWALPNVSNGYESKCIKEIVRNISSDLAYNSTSTLGSNFIGMEPRVQNVKSLLLKGLDEVYMVGIWGMGGMGKTTLARAVFSDISNYFEGKCFVSNVREDSKTVRGLLLLQEKILSEVLMERNLKVSDINDGFSMMSRLCHKKVLLVLDDVDRVEQLEALAGNREWFGKGSRIIITTRDEHLLVLHEVNEIHKAVLLDKDESLSLFNKHAFKSNIPLHEYVEPSNVIVNSVGGLPLAIRVLGSFLYGRTVVEWKAAIEKLKKHSANREILGVLKISFDGLEHNEQEIFLDIACFFIGMKKDDVSEILDSFEFYPDIGLSVLIEKSLLNIVNGTLQMHDMIKELAWDIVYQMDPNEPGRRSRLWLQEDVQTVLTNDTGTEAIEGIQLDSSYLYNSFEALRNMKKLRLLDVINLRDECEGPVPECLPNELRCIRWERYPSECLPPNFNAKKLVHLHMRRSSIVELWKGRKILDRLKLIDLSSSELITKTPDFSGVPNLEKLILDHCMNLEEVHSSLGDLQRLTFLNLSWCKRLKRLPFGFNMKSLEIIFLNCCWELEVFPQILGDMNSLTKLHLNNTAIKELHHSIGKLTGLVLLDLNSCHDIKSLPTTIGSLKSLKSLNLGFCTGLEELPETLGHIESLEDLNLNWAALREPPSSITLLKNLKTLSFGSIKDYISASKGESTFYHASSLLWQNLSRLFLKRLVIAYCQLAEVPDGISELSTLEELSLAGNVFTYLPDTLCQLSRLKILALDNCKNLKSLPELPLSIAMLDIGDCSALESIGDLLVSKREFLHDVSLKDCIRLVTNKQHCAYSNFTLSHKVLQTMLQWRSVIKHHQFSILVPGKETLEWVWQDTETSCSHLKLLPEWDKSIVGFAMCRSIRSTAPDEGSNDFPRKIDISLGHKYNKTLEHTVWRSKGHESYAVDHLWIAYISLDFFGKLIFGDAYSKESDWSGGNEASFLEIYYHKSYPAGSGNFGVRVIYKEDLNHITDEEEDHMISPANYADDYGFYPYDKENNY